eukprot:gene6341-4568_t
MSAAVDPRSLHFEHGAPSVAFHRAYPCFQQMGNGLLFRLVDVKKKRWYFYNDTTRYDMCCRCTFVLSSATELRPLGHTTPVSPINPDAAHQPDGTAKEAAAHRVVPSFLLSSPPPRVTDEGDDDDATTTASRCLEVQLIVPPGATESFVALHFSGESHDPHASDDTTGGEEEFQYHLVVTATHAAAEGSSNDLPPARSTPAIPCAPANPSISSALLLPLHGEPCPTPPSAPRAAAHDRSITSNSAVATSPSAFSRPALGDAATASQSSPLMVEAVARVLSYAVDGRPGEEGSSTIHFYSTPSSPTLVANASFSRQRGGDPSFPFTHQHQHQQTYGAAPKMCISPPPTLMCAPLVTFSPPSLASSTRTAGVARSAAAVHTRGSDKASEHRRTPSDVLRSCRGAGTAWASKVSPPQSPALLRGAMNGSGGRAGEGHSGSTFYLLSRADAASGDAGSLHACSGQFFLPPSPHDSGTASRPGRGGPTSTPHHPHPHTHRTARRSRCSPSAASSRREYASRPTEIFDEIALSAVGVGGAAGHMPACSSAGTPTLPSLCESSTGQSGSLKLDLNECQRLYLLTYTTIYLCVFICDPSVFIHLLIDRFICFFFLLRLVRRNEVYCSFIIIYYYSEIIFSSIFMVGIGYTIFCDFILFYFFKTRSHLTFRFPFFLLFFGGLLRDATVSIYPFIFVNWLFAPRETSTSNPLMSMMIYVVVFFLSILSFTFIYLFDTRNAMWRKRNVSKQKSENYILLMMMINAIKYDDTRTNHYLIRPIYIYLFVYFHYLFALTSLWRSHGWRGFLRSSMHFYLFFFSDPFCLRYRFCYCYGTE